MHFVCGCVGTHERIGLEELEDAIIGALCAS